MPRLGPIALRSLGDFLGVAALAIALSLPVLLLLAVVARQDLLSLAPLADVLFMLAMAAAVLWWDRRRPLPPPAVTLPAPWRARKGVLLGVLAGCLLLLMDRLIAWLLTALGMGDIQAANEEPIRQALAAAPLLTGLQVGLAAPWLEERFIRARLFGRFRNGGRTLAGALLTSLLFAWLHEFGPDDGQRLGEWLALIAVYAWSGLVFCALYAWSGRLMVPVAAHATNNLVLCALLWLDGLA